MSNRQLHNLTPISNSIDSADLFVVIDKSELTTNTISLGELSDALDGTIFLSSSYATTSSLTRGTTPSSSLALNVTTSLYASNVSGSGVYAYSSSFAVSSSYCHTHRDLFEITSSDDTLNILTSPVGDAIMYIRPRQPFGGPYVIKSLNHLDTIGSQIIRSGSVVTYSGLPANTYEFEVSKLDSIDRSLGFGVTIQYTPAATVRYSEFVYFYPGGAQSASGSGVAAISASLSVTSSYSKHSSNVISSSTAIFTSNCSGSGVFARSSSFSNTSERAEKSSLALSSSNGPLAGMILIYAGVFLSGSTNWYNCDGRTYTSSLDPGLAAAIGQKFATGSSWPTGPVVINRLPKISTNLPTSSGGSGPENENFGRFTLEITSSGPTNSDISKSYAVTSYITGSYSDGTTVYGTTMGPSGSAFFYNIKR